MNKIFVHGTGHKANSWNETITYMNHKENILCPDLSSILNGKDAAYSNLYSAFTGYCNRLNVPIHLCGISLGGILSLNYAIDFSDKVKSLVLIGTPHKIPKVMLHIQNIIFRFFPKSIFENMAFNKKDTFALGNSMKALDFFNRVQNVQCPTLIICGENDRANLKSAHYFSENIKNAKEEILENTGHVVNEEKPELLAKILDEFYERMISNEENTNQRISEYLDRINWNVEYKDNDCLPEVCPICRRKVFINFYGSYHQSYTIHCETPNCMNVGFRGL